VGVLAGGYLLLHHRSGSEAGGADLLPLPPPPGTIVCRSGPIPACASAAGSKMAIPTAWLPAPSGYRMRWFAAHAPKGSSTEQRTASEELVSTRLEVTVRTQPGALSPSLRPAGRYTIAGAPVNAYLNARDSVVPVVTFVWTRLGRQYTLSVGRYHAADTASMAPADYVWLVRQVRYAGPSGSDT